MPSVETQLQELARHLDAAFADIELGELTHPSKRVPPARLSVASRPRVRPWVAMTGAALLILALGALSAGLLLFSADDPPVISEPPPLTTEPPRVTTTVPRIPAPPAVTPPGAFPAAGSTLLWERLAVEDFLKGRFGITGGDPFVSLGQYETDGLVHTSADGLRWDSHAVESPHEVHAVDVGNDSIIIVARDFIEVAAVEDGANLFSQQIIEIKTLRLGADGAVISETTTRIAPEPGARYDIESEAVAVGRRGAIVPGEVSDPEGNPAVGPRSWFSVDGEVWSTIEPIPGAANDAVRLFAVEDGFFVVDPAVEPGEREYSLWFSPDGSSWNEVACCAFEGPSVREWRNGVLLTDGHAFWHATSAGATELEIRGPEDRPNRDGDWTDFIAASDLGIVLLHWEERQIYYSADGTAWSITAMPPEFVPPNGPLWMWSSSLVANSEAILIPLWDPETGAGILWRATAVPPRP